MQPHDRLPRPLWEGCWQLAPATVDPRDDRAFVDMDGGMSRFRHAAHDSHSEPDAPVELPEVPIHGTGSADAATTTEESSPTDAATRVTTAREYGRRVAAEVAAGRPTPQALALPPGPPQPSVGPDRVRTAVDGQRRQARGRLSGRQVESYQDCARLRIFGRSRGLCSRLWLRSARSPPLIA